MHFTIPEIFLKISINCGSLFNFLLFLCLFLPNDYFFYFQMSTSSYPGMAQSFSMSHGTNMSTVAGMRQDAMSKTSIILNNNIAVFLSNIVRVWPCPVSRSFIFYWLWIKHLYVFNEYCTDWWMAMNKNENMATTIWTHNFKRFRIC